MLTRLTVENYALIERLELILDPHLNIITGETGAGKSILLGALGLLLGAKNDGATIKDNERNCVIEGTFDITGLGLETLFEEMDIDYDNETVIRRIITPAGKSRSYVNDLPVQLSQLKELGTHLIDIHSQHQNLILASEAFRTQALDTIAANGTVMNSYREEYTRFKSLERRLAELKTAAAEAGKEEEWIRFQAGELTSANLREGEVEELEAEQAELENADTTSETLAQITASFDGDEEGVLVSLKNAENGLRHISSSYKPAGELADRIHSTILELRDINATVASDAERIESDPERLEKVNDRLATLYTLCQKHRVQNVDELIVLRDKFRKQLEAITSGDEEIAALEAETAAARARASALADKLHDGRAKAAPAFGREMAGAPCASGHARRTFHRRGHGRRRTDTCGPGYGNIPLLGKQEHDSATCRADSFGRRDVTHDVVAEVVARKPHEAAHNHFRRDRHRRIRPHSRRHGRNNIRTVTIDAGGEHHTSAAGGFQG